MTCEGCPNPATTADDAGTPLCDACFLSIAAEPAPEPPPHPMFVEGYEAGFADAINDTVLELMGAAKAYLHAMNSANLYRLRSALYACKRRAA